MASTSTSSLTSTAAERVYAIPELLEQILLLCDPHTVLRANRISRHIHAVIAGSTKLQQELFLTPDCRNDDDFPDTNPLFERLGDKRPDGCKRALIVIWDGFRDDDPAPGSEALATFNHPGRDGSVTRMFVTQPPLTRMTVQAWGNLWGTKSRLPQKFIENEDGIMWGDVCKKFPFL